MINYLSGDATSPVTADACIIAHVCNNARAWGAGFVLAISARWAEPEAAYRSWSGGYGSRDNPPFKLGSVQWVPVESGRILVANMVAQQGLRSYQNPIPLNYEALGKCLVQVAERAKSSGAIVCMPRIGCGLAGGSWDKVSAIIEDKLTGVEVHVYDLPTSSC